MVFAPMGTHMPPLVGMVNHHMKILTEREIVVTDMTIDDIRLREKVIKKWMEHSSKIARMLIQKGQYTQDEKIFTDGIVYLCTDQMINISPNTNFPSGSWFIPSERVCAYDIIMLNAYAQRKTYKQSMYELIDAFEDKKFFGKNDEKKVKWHIQENHRIDMPYNSYAIDSFYSLFLKPYSEHIYINRHGAKTAKVYKFSTHSKEHAEIFYTIWHRGDSEELKVFPVFPQKQYMLYNAHLIYNYRTTPEVEIIFQQNEQFADQENNKRSNCYDAISSACPGGNKNLLYADFTDLSDKNICIVLDDEIFTYEYCSAMRDKCTKDKIVNLYFHHARFGRDQWEDVQTLLADPSRYGLRAPTIEASPTTTTIRKSKFVIEPIIKRNQVCWLHGNKELGKSFIALMLAYMAAKGNIAFGPWLAKDINNVLIIDGEQDEDDVKERAFSIMRGFSDYSEKIPFDIEYATKSEYGVINVFDKNWQKKNASLLQRRDLIILDNYATLTNFDRYSAKDIQEFKAVVAKNGAALLILDHTGADGDLQGSQEKKWISPVVLSLKGNKKNFFRTISYEFGRNIPIELKKDIDFNFLYENNSCRLIPVDIDQSHQTESDTGIFDSKNKKIIYAHELKRRGIAQELKTHHDKMMGVGGQTIYTLAKECEDLLQGNTTSLANKEQYLTELKRLQKLSDRELIEEINSSFP